MLDFISTFVSDWSRACFVLVDEAMDGPVTSGARALVERVAELYAREPWVFPNPRQNREEDKAHQLRARVFSASLELSAVRRHPRRLADAVERFRRTFPRPFELDDPFEASRYLTVVELGLYIYLVLESDGGSRPPPLGPTGSPPRGSPPAVAGAAGLLPAKKVG